MDKPANQPAPANPPTTPSDVATAPPKKRPTWMIVLAALVLIVGALCILLAMQPSSVLVARSATINAPVADVFPHVNDLKNWKPWNPWGKIDPNMKETFEGTHQGIGSAYQWEGNSDVGKGHMAIVESRKDEL